MTATIIHHTFGSQNRHVAVIKRPDDIISTAADLSLADKLRSAGEAVCNHLEKTQQPLNPHDRARLMRAIAALKGQPL